MELKYGYLAWYYAVKNDQQELNPVIMAAIAHLCRTSRLLGKQ